MLKIITDEETLRSKCRVCMPFEYEKIKKIIAHQMIETINSSGNGVGLSAPQIGHKMRFFLVYLGEKRIPTIFINPTILSYSDEKEAGVEGCLSFPNHFGTVTRSKSIKMKYLKGTKMVISEFEDFDARVIQHEYDHLDGILCIDKMTDSFIEEPLAEKAKIQTFEEINPIKLEGISADFE